MFYRFAREKSSPSLDSFQPRRDDDNHRLAYAKPKAKLYKNRSVCLMNDKEIK